ncbi:MAG: sulfatase-like hydrolase/transferase [Gammaproteobacteria bacterium]|nr:sulfatase-like hydrolase/transferase [Gammaproteobacteria bacterium]
MNAVAPRLRRLACPLAVISLLVAIQWVTADKTLAAPAKDDKRPNVIVIVADDMGSGDFSAAGGRLPTPNIDRLANSGVRMTEAYVTAAVCAPSRAGMLAGRPQTRFGYEFNPVGRDEANGLSLNETTLAQTMKRAGYRTGMVGKWHVGQAAGYHPLDRGFDSFFGILGGATPYLRTIAPGDLHVVTDEDALITRKRLPIIDDREPFDTAEYVTDLFTDRAIRFIGEQPSGDPFFLYFAYTAPHTPLQASARYMARVPEGGSDFQRVYAGMMFALDDGIGRLLDHLEKTGQRDNTLIIFLSDNGCPGYIGGACSNGILNGYKGYPWDGGLRVPFLVSWPERIRPAVRHDVVSSLDIAATIAAAAGTVHPKAEGVDLLPVIDGKRALRERGLFWRMGPTSVVRKGRWKMITVNKSSIAAKDGDALGRSRRADGLPATVSPLGQWTFLYDLQSDPGEKVDVAAKRPDVVARLRREWAAWDAANVPPQWTSRRSVNAEVNGARVELFN